MPTRFYFPAEGSGAPSISPAFDAGWAQTGQATRLKLLNKKTLATLSTIANSVTKTVPITTTQSILGNQFVSDPIPSQRIDTSVLVSLVLRFFENATTNNTALAVVIKVFDSTGTVARGTLFSVFGTGSNFPVSASASTSIIAQTAVTALTTLPGDRLVVEVGGHAAAPSVAGSFTMRQGFSAASDFALTAGLTTDLNAWVEFSSNVIGNMPQNYLTVKGGDGLGLGERIR